MIKKTLLDNNESGGRYGYHLTWNLTRHFLMILESETSMKGLPQKEEGERHLASTVGPR